ncbi:hypothetical protein [Haloarcula mannanilytica]|nr:hypothetical protein [Haloarcula mannanilytica]
MAASIFLLPVEIRFNTSVELPRVVLTDAESTTVVGLERVIDDLIVQLLVTEVLIVIKEVIYR